jgi:hypothetical protein
MNSKGGSKGEDRIQRDTFHKMLLEKWNKDCYAELGIQIRKFYWKAYW